MNKVLISILGEPSQSCLESVYTVKYDCPVVVFSEELLKKCDAYNIVTEKSNWFRAAIQNAFKEKFDYLYIMNNKTSLKQESIETILENFNKDDISLYNDFDILYATGLSYRNFLISINENPVDTGHNLMINMKKIDKEYPDKNSLIYGSNLITKHLPESLYIYND